MKADELRGAHVLVAGAGISGRAAARRCCGSARDVR